MPASAVIASTSWIDSAATMAKCYFVSKGSDNAGAADSYAAFPKAEVKILRIQGGREPSYAVVHIPLSGNDGIDESANALAGVRASPLESIKQGDRAVIKTFGPNNAPPVVKLVGRVAEIVPDLGSDSATVTIMDGRWELQGCPIIGAHWKGNSGPVYINREHSHCNRDGKANCMFSGGLPFFCFENSGLVDGQFPAPAAKKDTARASHWTPISALDYVRYALTDGATVAQAAGFPVPKLSEFVVWEDDATSVIEDPQKNLERKFPDWPLNGNNVNDVIAEVLTFSTYHLNMFPLESDGSWCNSVQFVENRYTGQGSTLKRTINGTVADDWTNPDIVTSGNLRESSKNTYTRVYVSGAPVFIECRLHTRKGGGLSWGWAGGASNGAGDLAQARQYAKKMLNKRYIDEDNNQQRRFSQIQVIQMIFSKFPRLFCTAFVNPNLKFTVGTPEVDFPLSTLTKPILPSLCTTKLVDAAAASQKGQLNEPYQIPVELWFSAAPADSNTYVPAKTDTGSGTSQPGPTGNQPVDTPDTYDHEDRHSEDSDELRRDDEPSAPGAPFDPTPSLTLPFGDPNDE